MTGEVLDSNLVEEDINKIEEQFTMARLYANKTKTVVESLQQEQHKQTGEIPHTVSSLALFVMTLVIRKF